MKKNEIYDIAEKMYVEQFITEAEIARRLRVSDRTIRRWKAIGDWGIKRDGFYKINTISKDAMYALARKMLKDFLFDLENNNFVDTSRINIFLNLTEEVLKQRKQSYKIKEFIKIAKATINFEKEIDLEFRKMMLEYLD